MRKLQILVVALALAALCPLASAQVFSENFDSYASGSALHGVGGWKGWDNTPGAGAPTSSKYAYSGKNSVEVVGSADLVHEFRVVGGRCEFSAMQYVPRGSTGNTFFILMNQYADGGAGNDWSVQLNFNLATGIVVAEALGGNATADIVYDRWVELKFRIDLVLNTCEWYYDGVLVKTHQWDDNAHGTLQAIDLYGNNASSIYYDDIKITQYYEYKAVNVSPADGATGVTMGLLQWAKGDQAHFHNVYFGTSPELTEADLVKSKTTSLVHYQPVIQPGVTYYWRVDELEVDATTLHTGDVWSFTAAPQTAFAPQPRDGDKWIAVDTVLSWTGGQTATEYDIYLGTDAAAVANRDAGVFQGTQETLDFTPETLLPQTRYYWAVDSRDSVATYPGQVWSFTTAGGPGGVKGEYFQGMTPGNVPAITRVDTNIDFAWGEGSGPGEPLGIDQFSARWTADLEVAIADTYTFITNSDDGSRLWLDNQQIVNQWVDQGPTDAFSAPIYLEPGIYSLKMEYYENGGGAVARLFWQTPTQERAIIPAGPLQPPVHAKPYYPMNKAAGIRHDVILNWTAGMSAVEHDVYLGQDKDAVAAATTETADVYYGRQALAEMTFDPGTLESNTTYYWRIDEVNDANPASPWIGAVWSFTTADFIAVDDMDSYTDENENRIFDFWVDGIDTKDNGSVVGYDPAPFAERTIVHSPSQSMPLTYDNTTSPYYSEARRTFATAQNWTVDGAGVLSLFVRGKTLGDPAVLYVLLEDSTGKSAIVTYPDNLAVVSVRWIEWKIPLSDFAGVNPAKIKKMYIGVGNRSNPVQGGTGTIYVDDIRVVKP